MRSLISACLAVMALVAAVLFAPPARAQPGGDFGSFWREVVRQTQQGKAIRIASTMRNDPACSDALRILEAFPQAAAAYAASRHGDYLKILAVYQKRMLCLDAVSMVSLDRLLTIYLAGATTGKPATEAANLRIALFNFGVLNFDQAGGLTNSSWWVHLAAWQDEYRSGLRAYPAGLGLWTYDVNSGLLKKLHWRAPGEMALDALLKSEELAAQRCYLGDMVERTGRTGGPAASGGRPSAQPPLAGRSGGMPVQIGDPGASIMTCGANPARGNGQGGGTGGGVAGADGADQVACAITAAQSSGMRGQYACVAKALGLGQNLSTPQQVLSGGLDGVPDRVCMRSSQAADGGTAAPAENTGPIDTEVKPKTWLERLWDWIKGVFSPAPPVLDDLASEDGAKIAATGLGLAQDKWATDYMNTLSDEKGQAFREAWRGMSHSERQQFIIFNSTSGGNKRPDGPGGGDACSDPSGALARVQKAYSCMTGQQVGANGGVPQSPRGGGGTIGRSVDPDATSGLPGQTRGAMSCFIQGGELTRLSEEDSRCAVAKCADPDNCTCNGRTSNPGIALNTMRAQCRSFAYCSPDGECPCDTLGGRSMGATGTGGTTVGGATIPTTGGTGPRPPGTIPPGVPPAPGPQPRPGRPPN